MIYEKQLREQTVEYVAALMLSAIRTAPKGRGRDTLDAAMASPSDVEKIVNRMKEMAAEYDMAFLERDASNLLKSDALVLVATRIESLGLKQCGFCGMQNCQQKNMSPEVPCAFNTIDLGIALGSAVSVATAHHIDNRIMFSVGLAVKELGLFGEDAKVILGIPLSVSAKSPYFDR
ncbi:MAG: DUF2148 domain-containing protein [Bacteroidales bacterium]|jgi:uncharacterized ferredoxin-like protein|nr:DUF2148 domain-containing protein [Bacteroidales bacterium]